LGENVAGKVLILLMAKSRTFDEICVFFDKQKNGIFGGRILWSLIINVTDTRFHGSHHAGKITATQ